MEDDNPDFDIGAVAWSSTKAEVSPAEVLEKEKIVKEILLMQEGLKALLERVDDVTTECAKLKGGNDVLRNYIDNLSRNSSVFFTSSQKVNEFSSTLS
ncbi:hypothetical protein BT69DRAFT_1338055 [Atractiella rhizophila]|nr:hypothetical protein BT69DRAFT_1338055 [Atractiella rhizophila]